MKLICLHICFYNTLQNFGSYLSKITQNCRKKKRWIQCC